MKKLAVLLMVFVMAFSLAGCSKNSTSQNGSASKVYFDMFNTNKYHMKATQVSSSATYDMETWVDGNKIATITNTNGESYHMIVENNTAYIIDDSAKTITTMGVNNNDLTGSDTVNVDGMSYVDSGTAEFAGKNLPYDEYSDGKYAKMQFFMDGNKLTGIRNIVSNGNIDIEISQIDQNIPASVFEIPSNYKQN